MARTLPPWTSKWRMAKFFAAIDDAELAARINNINTFDRRGNVVFWDDFQSSINTWQQSKSGTGSEAFLSTDRVFHGGSSVKLTTGSDASLRSALIRYFELVSFTRVGMEWVFSLGADVDHIELFSEVDDGATIYQVFVGIDVDSDKFTYGNRLAPTDLPDGGYAFYEDQVYWYHAKVVFDYSTKKYVRFLFAEKSYDMSAFDLLTFATTGYKFMSIQLRAYSASGENGVVYVGKFIFTQNEP